MGLVSYILGPAGVILIGAIIVAIGGFLASVNNTANQKKLQDQSEEISKLNEFIAASVTGGDTYPYINVSFDSTPRGLIIFRLMSEGKYPLYDIGVNVIDNDKAKEIMKNSKNPGGEDPSQWRFSFHIPTFRPNEVREVTQFQITDSSSERNFSIELMARNGFFKQQIKIIKDSTSLKTIYEVKKGDTVLKKNPE